MDSSNHGFLCWKLRWKLLEYRIKIMTGRFEIQLVSRTPTLLNFTRKQLGKIYLVRLNYFINKDFLYFAQNELCKIVISMHEIIILKIDRGI